MVNSVDYTRRYYPEKQHIKAERIRESLEIKGSNYDSSKLNTHCGDCNLVITNT